MSTGFDLLTHDQTLQKHWLKRFIAIVIDVFLIFVPVNIFMSVFGWTNDFLLLNLGGYVSGFVWFIYSSLLDHMANGTIGKLLLGLRVVSVRGRLEPHQSMMRNITKVFGLFLIIDFLVGMLVDTSDPRQKYTDRLAATSVISHREIPF